MRGRTIDFAAYANTPHGRATISVRAVFGHSQLLAHGVSLGAMDTEAKSHAACLNYWCDCGGGKSSLLLFDAKKLDVETVAHEVRHALMWLWMPRPDQNFEIDPRSYDEEMYNDQVDDLTYRVLRMLAAVIEKPIDEIPYRR